MSYCTIGEVFENLQVCLDYYEAETDVCPRFIENFRNKLAEYDSLEELKKDIEIIYMQSL